MKKILILIIIIGLFSFALPTKAQDCQNMLSENKRDTCWVDQAEAIGDASICNNIVDDTWKSYCHAMISSRYPTATNCQIINKSSCYDAMYIQQAEAENDLTICEKVNIENHQRDYCYKNLLEKNNSLCDQVIEQDLNLAGKEFCYKLWANQRVDTQYCNHVKGSECYYDIFDLPGGVSMDNCKNIDYENARNSCFSKLSKMNNSPYYCLYNKGFARTDCLNNFPIVGVIGSIIYAVIVLILVILYILLKKLFAKDKIKNKTVFKGIIRGLIHAIPGYILFVLSSYFSFYSYWIGGVRGEDGMGVGIIMVTVLWPISLIITIILFIRGVLWKK